jgi:hypothetical protein
MYLQESASWFVHYSFTATSVLSQTYGYNIKSQGHPVIKLVENLTNIIAEEGSPEKAALLQTFPFGKLYLLPSTECSEYQSSQISAFLVSWPWLHRPRCDLQTNVQGRGGAALWIHEGRSCAWLIKIVTSSLVYLDPFKAAGSAPQSMVADFIQQEDKDSELYPDLEAAMKAAAATVYIGRHSMLTCCCALTGHGFIAGAETVRRDRFRNRSFDSIIWCS